MSGNRTYSHCLIIIMHVLMINFTTDIGMGRKLRFYQRPKRNREKKKINKPLIVSVPITILQDERKETLLGLHEVASLLGLPTGWVEQQTDDPANRMVLVTLLETSVIMVTIDNSFNVALKCDGHVVNLNDFPQILRRVNNMRELHSILTTIRKYKVCRGNLVEEFKNVLDDETLRSVRMGVFAMIIVYTFIKIIIIITGKEIVHQQHCTILCGQSLCHSCLLLRKRLTVRKSRHRLQRALRTDPSAHVPYLTLSKDEMKTRMKNLHTELRKIQKQKERLIHKVDSLVERDSVTLNPADHNDMRQLILKEEEKVETQQLTQFQKLFWHQQAEASKKEDSRGMKWHPKMIKWCIYLRHQSQKAYEAMRQCVHLPSQRTLRDYTHHVKANEGFSVDVDDQLCKAARMGDCEEREKYVMLLVDEMHIKEDLVFDKHTGNIMPIYNKYCII